MMSSLYIQPPEAISERSTEGGVWLKPASTADTSALTPGLSLCPKRLRECPVSEKDIHVHLECTCTLHSLTSPSQNNNQGRKEEKATANDAAVVLGENAWVLNPSPWRPGSLVRRALEVAA